MYIPYIFEFFDHVIGAAIEAVPGLLATLYGSIGLIAIYLMIGKIPLPAIPILAFGLVTFSTDYWEYPYFLLQWIPIYFQQVAANERHFLSFLWSSSFLHLYIGSIVALLLKLNITKKKVFIFFVTPWIMYVRALLLPMPYKMWYIGGKIFGKLGPIAVPVGVSMWFIDRLICCLVLLYLLNGAEWRGITNSLKIIINKPRRRKLI